MVDRLCAGPPSCGQRSCFANILPLGRISAHSRPSSSLSRLLGSQSPLWLAPFELSSSNSLIAPRVPPLADHACPGTPAGFLPKPVMGAEGKRPGVPWQPGWTCLHAENCSCRGLVCRCCLRQLGGHLGGQLLGNLLNLAANGQVNLGGSVLDNEASDQGLQRRGGGRGKRETTWVSARMKCESSHGPAHSSNAMCPPPPISSSPVRTERFLSICPCW